MGVDDLQFARLTQWFFTLTASTFKEIFRKLTRLNDHNLKNGKPLALGDNASVFPLQLGDADHQESSCDLSKRSNNDQKKRYCIAFEKFTPYIGKRFLKMFTFPRFATLFLTRICGLLFSPKGEPDICCSCFYAMELKFHPYDY